MYTFKQEYNDELGYVANTEKVHIVKDKDISLPELLDEFTMFLRGCGFHFEGEVGIVNDEFDEPYEYDNGEDTQQPFDFNSYQPYTVTISGEGIDSATPQEWDLASKSYYGSNK
jgi:hypothetical protein